MAVFALTNEYVEINSVDMSSLTKAGTLTLDSAVLDSTAMGDSWQEVIGGVKAGTLAVEFNDDFAASQTDALLFPLFGTVVTFEVRPDAGSVSATNPSYSGSVHIGSWEMGGSHGELASKSLSFTTSGAVTRATS